MLTNLVVSFIVMTCALQGIVISSTAIYVTIINRLKTNDSADVLVIRSASVLFFGLAGGISTPDAVNQLLLAAPIIVMYQGVGT